MQVIKDLLNSKKFVGALITMVSAIVVKLGIPEASLQEIVALISPMLTYIGAQGFADYGKAKALVEQQTMINLNQVEGNRFE